MHKPSLLPTHKPKTLRATVVDRLQWAVALWCLIALALNAQGWWQGYVAAYYA